MPDTQESQSLVLQTLAESELAKYNRQKDDQNCCPTADVLRRWSDQVVSIGLIINGLFGPFIFKIRVFIPEYLDFRHQYKFTYIWPKKGK